ncbi:MAG: DUF1207 domain-containing protein [bacterium]
MQAGQNGEVVRRCLGALAVMVLVAGLVVPGAVRAQDDSFIRGYTAAVLQRDFEIPPEAVSVQNGVVSVRADMSDDDQQRLRTALGAINGVERIEVIAKQAPVGGWSFLPRRELFQSLIADPRWPHFSAAYQYYIGNKQLSSVAAVSFGESFPLVQYDFGDPGALQLGLQASVFAIFDLDSASFDLVNADYFVALPISYAIGNWSVMGRVLHQSSHLGDEYLLTHNVERINLSYEAIDVLASYETDFGLRTYGGAGYIFDADPSGLGRWSLQGGLEYLGEPFDIGIPARAVAALDLQLHEEGGWQPNVSPNVGLQLGNWRGGQRNLRILLQYFNGDSVNGQFLDQHIQYIGLGAQLNI